MLGGFADSQQRINWRAQHVYDDDDIVRQTVNGVATVYVHGPETDEPLAREDSAGSRTYLHADGLGSLMKETDSAGAVTLTRNYDAFGNPEAGSTSSGYAFTGREWDSEIELYFYRARYYDPRVGRFLSEDPIDSGGLNFFTYVADNPTNLRDPSGMVSVNVSQTTNVVPDPSRVRGCHSLFGCNSMTQSLEIACDDCGQMTITLNMTSTINVRRGVYIPFPAGATRPKDQTVINQSSAIVHEEKHRRDVATDSRRFLRSFERKYGSKEECEEMAARLKNETFPFVFHLFAQKSQHRMD